MAFCMSHGMEFVFVVRDIIFVLQEVADGEEGCGLFVWLFFSEVDDRWYEDH